MTEGDTLNVEITRNFPTELPIEVSIRGDGIANSDNQIPFEGTYVKTNGIQVSMYIITIMSAL